jgi:hypothetical protein
MAISLELTLSQPHCLQGQSVLFVMVLANIGPEPFGGADAHPFNRAIKLYARDARRRQYEGSQLGGDLRDGRSPNLVHWHIKTTALKPGEKLEISGDLLWWIGELPAGDYRLFAEYNPQPRAGGSRIRSREQLLRVTPARPALVSVPRLPEMTEPGPLTAFWRHGGPDDGKCFFQQQSRIQPPNPYHSFEIPCPGPQARPQVATVAAPRPAVGHVLWPDRKAVFVLPAAADKPTSAQPMKIDLPLNEPVILESARTTSEGDLLALISDAKLTELHLLQLKGGQSTLTKLDLGWTGPIGPYCVYWTLEDRLEFAWCPVGKRELYHTTAALDDPAGTFAPRPVGSEAARPLRIDMTRQRTIPLQPPGLEGPDGEPLPQAPATQPVPPSITTLLMFTLSADPIQKSLVLTRRELPGAKDTQSGSISLQDRAAGSVEVIDSVMTARTEPVYLLKDQSGDLFFASTLQAAIQPLEQLTGERITLNEFPSLAAGSADDDPPWVYLRYVNKGGTGFKFVKLEPKDVDPTYRMFPQE